MAVRCCCHARHFERCSAYPRRDGRSRVVHRHRRRCGRFSRGFVHKRRCRREPERRPELQLFQSRPVRPPADQHKVSGNPGNRNVHNDACFIDQNGNKADGPASFRSFGAGYISACPDPDGAGEKYSVLSDVNGDGRNDLCFQSGYQETGLPGDDEFHARMNKVRGEGLQTVVWCSDADADGCSDESVKDRIKIRWVH